MQKNTFFPYTWHTIDQEEEVSSMRIYGINKKQENVCLRVDDFTPYIYLELPTHINWNPSKAQLLGNKIDELMKNQKPLKKVLVEKYKLYGVYLDKNYKRKLFPYLLCSFSHKKDIKQLGFKIRRNIQVVGLGSLSLKIHESDADEILQMTCCRQIPTAGWIEFFGKLVNKEDQVTLCDLEFKVKWKHLNPSSLQIIPKPKIMGFDIEVNSTNPSAMPKATKPGDKIFQISCVFYRYGDTEKNYIKYLLSLGQPLQEIVGKDVIIYTYDTEFELLEGYTNLIRTENPNIISGYNILGFDIPYMIDRAKLNYVIGEFDRQGFHKYIHAKEKTIKWSSSAYKDQEFQFLDAEGRLFVDLLPLVKRDFKFNNYKLKTISEHFIGKTKDPLSVKGIFKCYRIGIKQNNEGEYSYSSKKAMAIVGKYCVQDSALVCLLMDKLQTWIGLTEMASTCNVPIFTLYTQGQQIKVFSQLYKYCMYENIVVEKDSYQVTDDERYVGAHVFPPIPGTYKNVIPFDFASLYPTTIIAYNIDYHTWVPDESDIPDSMCHVMEWEDHIGCIHDPKVIRKNNLTDYINKEQEKIKKIRDKKSSCRDKLTKQELTIEINRLKNDLSPYTKERAELNKSKPKFPMCAKRHYRFLKEPKGVLPTIIQNLLEARNRTRKVDIVRCKKEITETDNTEKIEELKGLIGVLDKRQLAYKVSANSMYGAMGVRKGYLPFMPGAMCTTYMGRTNIELVAKTIVEKYNGELVYGDTDSNYIYFPEMKDKTSVELWDYAEYVAENVTKLFPPPIKLEFEEAIYGFFFILTKKRYMYRAINSREGELEKEIGKKGVLLARRDNSKFVRDLYEGVIIRIADNIPRNDILYWINQEINSMFSRSKPYQDFIVTKSVGNCGTDSSGKIQFERFTNEKGVEKVMAGNYTLPLLSNDEETRIEQLKKKEADNEQEFYLLSLPAQVQLAERMKRRGQRVDPGTRLEYVVTDTRRHTAKQYEKVESAEYFSKHANILDIDFYYYLKAAANPIDQVLNVAFGKDIDWKDDYVLNQYNMRWKYYQKCLEELKKLFQPKLNFE